MESAHIYKHDVDKDQRPMPCLPAEIQTLENLFAQFTDKVLTVIDHRLVENAKGGKHRLPGTFATATDSLSLTNRNPKSRRIMRRSIRDRP